MCGIAGLLGGQQDPTTVEVLGRHLEHRGPDDAGVWRDPRGCLSLVHRRLAILDLTDAAHQPMVSRRGDAVIAFNGEVYNYRELAQRHLADEPRRSTGDTEVLVELWSRLGEACLAELVGMFAFLLWETETRRLVAVRDRFGVKPLYYGRLEGGGLMFASEIGALHAAGLPRRLDEAVWASYLATGHYPSGSETFWEGIRQVPAGCLLEVRGGETTLRRWYHVELTPAADPERALEGYRELLTHAVGLRYRADVPIGVALSGGVDSAALAALLATTYPDTRRLRAYTYTCGDPRYDEARAAASFCREAGIDHVVVPFEPLDARPLALALARRDPQPIGGIPTLAYARLFQVARQRGDLVLLDGQGMDEQWAGYDYYLRYAEGSAAAPLIQGSTNRATRVETLAADFAELATTPDLRGLAGDPLQRLQMRDLFSTKLPRALRFSDTVSMAASVELREPFLDHRLVELALSLPARLKVHGGETKWGLRRLTEALWRRDGWRRPKQPLQTPQREWLRGPLAPWARSAVEELLAHPRVASWFVPETLNRCLDDYLSGQGDNSFFVWQWINLALLVD